MLDRYDYGRKSHKHGCGGNRTQSKVRHIADSGLKTQRYCDAIDAQRGVRKRVNWFTHKANSIGKAPGNWGKSRFRVHGGRSVKKEKKSASRASSTQNGRY